MHRDRIVAGVSAVILAGGLFGGALFASPLKRVKSQLLDGSALVTDVKHGRVISVNGAAARADLAIRLPGVSGHGLSVVQRDGKAYVVANSGKANERILYRVDDPSARLPTATIGSSDRVLAGGGSLFIVRGNGDELSVQRRDPKTMKPVGDALQYAAGSRVVVDKSGNLAVYEPRTGVLNFVSKSGESSVVRVGAPGEEAELGVVGQSVIVARPKAGLAVVADAEGTVRRVSFGVKGSRAKIASSVDGDVTSLLVDAPGGPQLVRIDTQTGEVAAHPVAVDFSAVDAPLVARDGIYLPRPSAAQVLRVADDGAVVPIDVPVGRGSRAFEAFVDDGYVYVNNPDGPDSAVVDRTGARLVEKYSPAIREIAPNGKPKPQSRSNPSPPDSPTRKEAPRPTPGTTPVVTSIVPVVPAGPTNPGGPQIATPVGGMPIIPGTPAGASPLIPPAPSTTVAPATTTPKAKTSPVAVATAPSAPDLVATGSDRSANVSWSVADDGGSPVTGYTLTCAPDCGTGRNSPLRFPAKQASTVLSGLTNGDTYTLSVVATNAAGTGAASPEVTVVPSAATPPSVGSLDAQMATDGSGTATVSWAPPASLGGYRLDGYRLNCGTNGDSTTTDIAADATSVTIGPTGAVPHTWTYQGASSTDWSCDIVVLATLSGSQQRASEALLSPTFVPWQAPAQVQGLVAVGNDGVVNLAWQPTAPMGVAMHYEVVIGGVPAGTTTAADFQVPVANGTTVSAVVRGVSEATTGLVNGPDSDVASAIAHAAPSGSIVLSSPTYNQLVIQTSADWKNMPAESRTCTFSINGGAAITCSGTTTLNVGAGNYSAIMTLSNGIDQTAIGSNGVNVSDPPPPPPPRTARTNNNPAASRTFADAYWGGEGPRVPQNTTITDNSGRMCVATGAVVGGDDKWVYLPWSGGWRYSPAQDYTLTNVPGC